MILTTLMTAILTTTPAATAEPTCLDACQSYLQDSDDRSRCEVQCSATDTIASAALTSDIRWKYPALTWTPDWLAAESESPQNVADHAWCLSTCDSAELSATDQETCRLNCANAWSALTTTPQYCSEDASLASSAECLDTEESACARGCFVEVVECRSSCDELSARDTDVATCKLRCENVHGLCDRACTSSDPDGYVSTAR